MRTFFSGFVGVAMALAWAPPALAGSAALPGATAAARYTPVPR